jgi:zinc protease
MAVFARDSLMGPPHVLGEALAVGQTLKETESWPERIMAVSAAQVNDALRALLASPYQVTGLLAPVAAKGR